MLHQIKIKRARERYTKFDYTYTNVCNYSTQSTKVTILHKNDATMTPACKCNTVDIQHTINSGSKLEHEIKNPEDNV